VSALVSSELLLDFSPWLVHSHLFLGLSHCLPCVCWPNFLF
jgi:hypothetical protein